MLLTWFGSIFLFYLHYVYGPDESWMYTRFVMPCVPALILGSVLVLRDVLPRIGIAYAFARRSEAPANPWGIGATTLEWTLPSPPPFHQYETLPRVE